MRRFAFEGRTPKERRQSKITTNAERLARIGELLRLRGLIMASHEEQLERSRDGSYKALAPHQLIRKRWERLRELISKLRSMRSYDYYASVPHDEFFMALLQHYQICETPLTDVTQSLTAAATFALRASDIGYVYILGAPHPQGSISHFMDEQMVLVKLQNVCPPDALRPHYQEGYLIGRLPFFAKKFRGDDLAQRLLCKFRLDNQDGSFWDESFRPIPDDVLFPMPDPFEERLRRDCAL